MEGSSKDYQDEPDLELGPDSSKPASGNETPPSPRTAAAIRKEKGRVRFNSNAAVTSPPVIPSSPPPEPRTTPIAKPRPSLLRGNSSNSAAGTNEIDDGLDPESKEAMAAAQERARLIAANLQRDSAAISRDSLESSVGTAYDDRESAAGSNIPLQDLNRTAHNRDGFQKIPSGEHEHPTLKEEAFKLVRSHTNRFESSTAQDSSTAKEAPRQRRETLTELNDGNYDGVVYDVPEPEEYRGSVLSQLLKLYKPPEPPFKGGHNRNASMTSSIGGTSSPTVQGTPSGASTPTRKKWYNQNRSQDTLANLIEASARLANPNEGEQAVDSKNSGKKHGRPPMHKRAHSANRLSGFWQQQEARITVHIAETLSRQDYIIKLCRALMLYGAPTHRLEEYLSMTARVLEIDGQFLYLPGCMIISFDDRSTHTTEVRIVRTAQGIDLGKLKDVHLIYKEVMHDCIGVEEATEKLDVLMKRKDKFHAWLRVIVFGLTSVTAAPFSFGARLIDLPLIFAFGCLVGVLQLIVAPNSALYSNVFEVTATVVVSFLARLFGSINNSNLFCFGALAQGGIVMLLPGYMVCKLGLFPALSCGEAKLISIIQCVLLLNFSPGPLCQAPFASSMPSSIVSYLDSASLLAQHYMDSLTTRHPTKRLATTPWTPTTASSLYPPLLSASV